MPSHNVQHAFAFILAVTGGELLSEDHLLARVGDRRVEDVFAGLSIECPSGERARDFLHVLLGVPAVDAERVQFHQLASVVLVQAATAALLRLLEDPLALFRCRVHQTLANRRRQLPAGTYAAEPTATWTARLSERRMCAVRRALPVVEKEQHRRTLSDRAEQVAELAERIRTNHVAVVLRQIEARLAFPGKNAEVILPKIDHHLVQLALGRHRARQLSRLNLADHLLIPLRGLTQLRILREELLPFLRARHRRVVRVSFFYLPL